MQPFRKEFRALSVELKIFHEPLLNGKIFHEPLLNGKTEYDIVVRKEQ